MDRRSLIVGDLDPGRCEGLEIGPRHAPLVAKAEGRIRYVDFASVEEIRAGWTKPEVIDPATFVDVDVVWGERRLLEAAGGQVDYIVASHVLEHIPDLAGGLAELHATLRPGGLLGLAVPDRRFTFDLFRHESTLGEVVEARLLGYRRPSIRQVFDSLAMTRPNPHAEAWTCNPKGRLAPMPEKVPAAYEQAASLLTDPKYVDVHCWVFTPVSFLRLAAGMDALGWFPFRIEAFVPTRRGDLEFFVRLRAAGPDEAAAISGSIEAAMETLRDAPTPPEEAQSR